MKILLVTIGSLGDLHPFIAIGLELRRRGHRVILAAPDDYVSKIKAAGLDGRPVMPSFKDFGQRMGLDDAAVARRLMSDQLQILDQVLMPYVASGVAALDGMIGDVDLIVASQFAFAAPIAAEKHRLPLICVLLQPMSLFSACDPPRTPEFRLLVGPASGVIAQRWNALFYRAMRGMLRFRYAATIDGVRADQGLARSADAVLLDQPRRSPLTLCCYSPVFAALPTDAPHQARIVGFPMFDSRSGAPEQLDRDLRAFLAAGPAPLVFTLGSFAVFAPGNFYAEAVAVAKALHRRAILLVGADSDVRADDGVFVCGYAPHSLLFPRAAAIIHHGGMGTTAQALYAGRPQLVVPHMGDQYDNAARVRRLGVGAVLPATKFTARRAGRRIAALLTDPRWNDRANRIGTLVAREDGAAAAASAIEDIGGAPPRTSAGRNRPLESIVYGNASS